MKYLIKGEEYDFDFDWTLEEAFELKEKAFLTIAEFPHALQRIDPHAVAALIYVVLRRNRVAVKWDDVKKNYKLSDVEPVVEDVEAGEDVDPTRPAVDDTPKSSSRSGGKSRKSAP